MGVTGLPLWAIVLVACVVGPWLIRAFVDAEQRRAKKKTARLLQALTRGERAAGAASAASEDP